MRKYPRLKFVDYCILQATPLNQTNHFFNLGYGWLCKHCSAEDAERKHRQPNSPRQNEMLPFAFWDPRRQILSCRRCGIKEFIRNP